MKTSHKTPNQPEISLSTIEIPTLPASLNPIETPDLKQFKSIDSYIIPKLKSQINQLALDLGNKYGAVLKADEAPAGIGADLAIACHKLASILGKSPVQIAQDLTEELNQTNIDPDLKKYIKSITSEAGYINFEFDSTVVGADIIKEIEASEQDYGKHNIGEGKTIVIDCSGVNIAKFMSVGHLRSTVIGESLSRIYKAVGYKVIRDNHLGDWGTQFGMLGRAYELWYDELKVSGDSDVQILYQLYVKIHNEVEIEKENNPDQDSVLATEGRQWFKRLEEGDPKAIELLNWATKQSLAEFQHIYDILGVKFEYMLGESYYVPMIPPLVDTMLKTGTASQDETGAIVVYFDEEKKNRLVIQKADGSSLYATRDLATIIARKSWFHPEKILYVVGGDQKDYLRQMFETYEMLDDSQSTKLEHVSFGLISLPEGKMSTRKGRVVFLGEVLDEAISRAEDKMKSSKAEFSAEEFKQTAQDIGVGSVVYFDLGQSRDRNIKFDWDQALSTEGNSAPYLQYSHARAESILRKAKEQNIEINQDSAAEVVGNSETELVKHLGKFSEAISKAQLENEPSVISAFVFRAADLFNHFYNESPILVEKDTEVRNTKLRLTAATAQVLRNGLALLNIKTPSRM